MRENYDLLDEYNKRNEAVWKIIFEQYFGKLSGYCYRITGNEQEANDIASESLTKLYEKPKPVGSLRELTALLYTIARNASFDYLRAQKRIKNGLSTLKWMEEDKVEMEALIDTDKIQAETELIAQIISTINQMPKQRKAVAQLAILKNQSIRQTAIDLQLAESTVYTHRQEALKTLRNEIGAHPFFDTDDFNDIK